MHNHNEDHHHEHPHTHEFDHGHNHTHDHEHEPAHDHDACQTHSHHHGGHDSLLGSKAEAAAFLQYTLHHNSHHAEELSDLAHSLEHLKLDKEAEEVRRCIDELARTDKRLQSLLDALQGQEV